MMRHRFNVLQRCTLIGFSLFFIACGDATNDNQTDFESNTNIDPAFAMAPAACKAKVYPEDVTADGGDVSPDSVADACAEANADAQSDAETAAKNNALSSGKLKCDDGCEPSGEPKATSSCSDSTTASSGQDTNGGTDWMQACLDSVDGQINNCTVPKIQRKFSYYCNVLNTYAVTVTQLCKTKGTVFGTSIGN